MQNETNLSRVKSAFESGLRLTVVSAIELCHTSELRVYVTQLIRSGLNIKSDWCYSKEKKWKVYYLEK